MTAGAELEQLRALAAACGVATGFVDWQGVHRDTPVETLLAVLRALDVDVQGAGDAARARAELERARAAELAPPCAAIFGSFGEVRAGAGSGALHAHLELEDGTEWNLGTHHHAVPLRDLPLGYHRLVVHQDGRRAETHIISAPTQAWDPPGHRPRAWGLFAPIYALRTASTGGAGDLGELGELARITRAAGGRVVGTLPLLAGYMEDALHDPSPYAPVSRRFWNELHADLRDPELALPAGVRARVAAGASELAALPLVDYRRQAAWKRAALESASRLAWRTRRDELEQFIATRPQVDDYARFRAAVDRRPVCFSEWPEAQRGGTLGPRDYAEQARRYHVFGQWLMQRQLGELAGRIDLYLDLPVGVHRFGYDAWRDRTSFAGRVSVGAPPDALFTGGQNWGLPPLHPEHARTGGHAYFRACVAAHVEHAALLRVDHVMGLHRLYWVPEGASATEGAYVRQPADELYAVLCLESVRARCAIAGEDLGTVPPEIHPTMAARGLYRLFVGQFMLPAAEGQTMAPAPHDTVASLDTHDTPTFAGWWEGSDIDDMVGLGLLTEEQAAAEHTRRRTVRRALARWLRATGDDPRHAIMAGLTEQLAASPAHLALVTLEDLWLEPRPQNVPGTGHERPNWRRRCSRRLEEVEADAEAMDLLRKVSALRTG